MIKFLLIRKYQKYLISHNLRGNGKNYYYYYCILCIYYLKKPFGLFGYRSKARKYLSSFSNVELKELYDENL